MRGSGEFALALKLAGAFKDVDLIRATGGDAGADLKTSATYLEH